MNLVLLPGNSKKNKEWIDSVELELKKPFKNTLVQYYDHWWSDDLEAVIDMDNELSRLEASLPSNERYALFAKSAGVLLALYGIYEGILEPEVCVFAGTAVNWGRRQGFDLDNWLVNYSIPTLFIQQSEDPAISAKDLDQLLVEKDVQNYSLIEIAGNDHHYADIPFIRGAFEDFYDV
jgi:hypothetical protein